MTDTTPEQEHAEKTDGRHILGWLLIPLSLFPLAALMNYDPGAIAALETPPRVCTNPIGPLGEYFAYYGYALFGFAVWIVPVLCIVSGVRVALRRRTAVRRNLLWSLLGITFTACISSPSIYLISENIPGRYRRERSRGITSSKRQHTAGIYLL